MQKNENSLMKIGDIVNRFNISHKSLHYWENAGILNPIRGENDYRYYDDENLGKIKKIVALRKLSLPIPVIHEILNSQTPNEASAILQTYGSETGKDRTKQAAASIVMGKLINMLNENKSIENICDYLENVPENENEVLKEAMRIITVEPVKEIELSELLENDSFDYFDLVLEEVANS